MYELSEKEIVSIAGGYGHYNPWRAEEAYTVANITAVIGVVIGGMTVAIEPGARISGILSGMAIGGFLGFAAGYISVVDPYYYYYQNF